jgi:hypothetical protein
MFIENVIVFFAFESTKPGNKSTFFPGSSSLFPGLVLSKVQKYKKDSTNFIRIKVQNPETKVHCFRARVPGFVRSKVQKYKKVQYKFHPDNMVYHIHISHRLGSVVPVVP